MNQAVLDNIAVELTASTCQYQTQGQVSYHCSSNLLGYGANYLVDYTYLPNGKQARHSYLIFFIHAYTNNINAGSGAFGNNGHDCKVHKIIGHMQPFACPEILVMDCTIRALQKCLNHHLQSHLVHAFMCNIGHENPSKGHSGVLLENFVQNIYLDITGNPVDSRLGSAVILHGFDSSFTT
jgi:hypothetical protein